jgi:hypothetical protein
MNYYNTKTHSKYKLNQRYLIDWLITNNLHQKDLAKEMAVSEQRLSYLINSKFPLTLRCHAKFVAALGILRAKDLSLFFKEIVDA